MKELERVLVESFKESKKAMPGLHHMSFEVNDRIFGDIYGFYHEGNSCKMYNSIAELTDLLSEKKAVRAKKEILFRKF